MISDINLLLSPMSVLNIGCLLWGYHIWYNFFSCSESNFWFHKFEFSLNYFFKKYLFSLSMIFAFACKKNSKTTFVFFFLLSMILVKSTKDFSLVPFIVALGACDQYWTTFMGHTGKCLHGKYSTNLKFRVSMTCHVLSKRVILAKLSEHVESCSSTTKNISTTTISMFTKLGKAVTYHEGLSPIKSHET